MGGAACTSNNDFDRDCAERGLGAGTLVGLAGMTALDAGLFAWERPHRAPPKPEREWYGWQLLFLDGAAIAAGAAFAQSDPETKDGEPLHPAAATWAMGYTVGLLAGPIVHFTHGRLGTGFASFGARALVGPMFALPGFIGYCAATAGVRGCASTGAQWGLLGGLVAVDVFDALVLAHDPVVDEHAYRPSLYVGQSTIGVAGYWP